MLHPAQVQPDASETPRDANVAMVTLMTLSPEWVPRTVSEGVQNRIQDSAIGLRVNIPTG